MKKIGLCTCFLDNYGACLQAFALQHQIEKLGYVCKVIPYIGADGYLRDDIVLISKMKLRCFAHDVLGLFKSQQAYDWSKKHLAFYHFRKKYLNFDNKIRFCYTSEQLEKKADLYDAFVCGSDQIWNPTFYKRNNPVYFLRFAGEKPRVAYAPSIGLSNIPEQYQEEFISFVKDFESISVREQQGAQIIKTLCNREAPVVLDPTILAGVDFWNSVLKCDYKPPFERYIFCYIFSNTEQSRVYLEKMQQETNLPIIYLNISKLSYEGLHAYCEQYADPIEFLQLIKHAEFVLTDSFHGTAFSLLFNKELYVFKREHVGEKIDMLSRLESILDFAGLRDRFVSLEQPFEIQEHIDYPTVNKRIDKLRSESEVYLKDALRGE